MKPSRCNWILAGWMLVSSPTAIALDYPFLHYGSHAKSSAGESVVGQLGPLAALKNPANLSVRREHGLYSELSLLNLNYQYERPGYDPVEVNMTLPVPFFGYSGHVGNFSFGVAGIAAPGSVQEQEIPAVPLALVGTEAALVDITMGGGDAISYLLGVGAAYRLPWGLAIGVGMIHSNIASRLEIGDHETGNHIVTLDTQVVSTAPLIGIRWRAHSLLTAGFAYEAAHQPDLKIESQSEGGGSKKEKGKRGEKLRLGVEAGGKIKGFAEIQRASHSKDVGDPLDIGLTPTIPDTIDTMSYVVGGRAVGIFRGTLSMGYGWYPSSVGDGIVGELSADGQEYAGASFGRFDAISRNVYGVGYKRNVGPGRGGVALSSQSGQRFVKESSRGYGSYSLRVIQIGVDYSLRF